MDVNMNDMSGIMQVLGIQDAWKEDFGVLWSMLSDIEKYSAEELKGELTALKVMPLILVQAEGRSAQVSLYNVVRNKQSVIRLTFDWLGPTSIRRTTFDMVMTKRLLKEGKIETDANLKLIKPAIEYPCPPNKFNSVKQQRMAEIIAQNKTADTVAVTTHDVEFYKDGRLIHTETWW